MKPTTLPCRDELRIIYVFYKNISVILLYCFRYYFVCFALHMVFPAHKTYIDSDAAECVRFTASHANFSFLMISASQIWNSLSFNWMSKQHFLQFITVLVACCLANTVISYEWSATDALSPRPTTSRWWELLRTTLDRRSLPRLEGSLTLLTNMGNHKGMAGWSRRCPLADAY